MPPHRQLAHLLAPGTIRYGVFLAEVTVTFTMAPNFSKAAGYVAIDSGISTSDISRPPASLSGSDAPTTISKLKSGLSDRFQLVQTCRTTIPTLIPLSKPTNLTTCIPKSIARRHHGFHQVVPSTALELLTSIIPLV